MTDRPILMRGPMVRTWLNGRKQQTRRLAWADWKTCTVCNGGGNCSVCDGSGETRNPTVWQKVRPGDRLWVREKWWAVEVEGLGIGNQYLVYDDEWSDGSGAKFPRPSDVRLLIPGKRWGAHPSTHMPRWASRLMLVVDETRIERLQKISEDDALAEGIDDHWLVENHVAPPRVLSFQYLWNSLYGNDSWQANPEVIVITATPHACNIDRMDEEAAE